MPTKKQYFIMDNTIEKSNIRIAELTSLRGIFMVMVFLFHEHVYEGGGTLGVTFFFILSGFSLTMGYFDKITTSDFNTKNFFKKRLTKFYPLHLLTLMAAIVLTVINVWLTSFDPILIPSFISNILLVQSWIPLESFYLSFNSVSWYLADTIFFVFLFPYIVRWINTTEMNIQYIIATIVIIGYFLLIACLPHNLYSPILYINPLVRLLDFVIGVYLALWVKNCFFNQIRVGFNSFNKTLPSLLIITVLLSLVGLIVISEILLWDYKKYAICYWPLVCLLIIATCKLNRAKVASWYNLLQNKWLILFGDISFAFYMIHQLVIRYMGIICKNVFPSANPFYITICDFIISLVVAIVVERWFVRPVYKRIMQ